MEIYSLPSKVAAHVDLLQDQIVAIEQTVFRLERKLQKIRTFGNAITREQLVNHYEELIDNHKKVIQDLITLKRRAMDQYERLNRGGI